MKEQFDYCIAIKSRDTWLCFSRGDTASNNFSTFNFKKPIGSFNSTLECPRSWSLKRDHLKYNKNKKCKSYPVEFFFRE